MGKTPKTEWYCGPLSAKQASAGMQIALQNAKRLIRDAELLLKKGRLPSAVGLAILAAEEAGKIRILYQLAVSEDTQQLKSAWGDYRNHKKKNPVITFYYYLFEGPSTINEIIGATLQDKTSAQAIEDVKQMSFYTDCLGSDATWTNPEYNIKEDLVPGLVNTVKAIIMSLHSVTEKEVELYIRCIKPMQSCSEEERSRAYDRYLDQLKELGVMPPISTEEIIDSLRARRKIKH